MRALLAAIAVLLAACPGGGGQTEMPRPPPDAAAPPPPAGQLTPEQEALADRAVALTVDLAGKMQAAGGDCARLTEIVSAWIDANGADQRSVNDQLGRLPEEVQNAVAERMKAKGREHAAEMKGMYSLVEGCMKSHPPFAEAWQRFEG